MTRSTECCGTTVEGRSSSNSCRLTQLSKCFLSKFHHGPPVLTNEPRPTTRSVSVCLCTVDLSMNKCFIAWLILRAVRLELGWRVMVFGRRYAVVIGEMCIDGTPMTD